MSTLGTQILNQINRIKTASEKIRAKAIEMSLDTLVETTGLGYNVSQNGDWSYDTSNHHLSFSLAEQRTVSIINPMEPVNGAIGIRFMNPMPEGYPDGYIEIGGVRKYFYQLQNNTEVIVTPSSFNGITVVYNGDYAPFILDVYFTFYDKGSISGTEKIDSVADAIDRMVVKTATITANGSIENGYYKNTSVAVESTIDDLQVIDSVVDVTNKKAKLYKDGSQFDIETLPYNFVSNGYKLGNLSLTNIPDTASLEAQVTALENEMNAIGEALEDM